MNGFRSAAFLHRGFKPLTTAADYNITSRDCFDRAAFILETVTRTGLLEIVKQEFLFSAFFYAALELRICIERLLWEQLYIFRVDDFTKAFEKLYRANETKKTIKKIEPHFEKKVEYINLIFAAQEQPERVVVPDLDKLDELYGRLGRYLHRQKHPGETVLDPQWWASFQQLLLRNRSSSQAPNSSHHGRHQN